MYRSLVSVVTAVLLVFSCLVRPARAGLPSAAGAATANAQQLPDYGGSIAPGEVGSVGGALGVDNGGNAVYSIPIEVPPGRGAMTPAIRVAYNSASSNGVVGRGWEIQGFSRVDLGCADHSEGVLGCIDGMPFYDDASLAYHDYAVSDDPSFEFELVEEEQPGDYYLTDPSDGSRIFREPNPNAGATCDDYKVRHANGDLSTYSCFDTVSNSPFGVPGQEILPLTRSEDIYGNYVEYEWIALGEFAEVLLPAWVRYTGNEAAGLAPTKTISFVYDQKRRDPTLVRGKTQISHRLTAVRVESEFSTTFREYRFVFDYGSPDSKGPSGPSLLKEVTECVVGGTVGATCLPPSRFDYTIRHRDLYEDSSGYAAVTISSGTGERTQPCHGPMMVDLDGNGTDELLLADGCGDGYLSVLSAETGSLEARPSPSHRLFSVSADAFPDRELVFRSDDAQAITVLSDYNGTTWSEVEVESSFGELAMIAPADRDGDGLTDILACENVENNWFVTAYRGVGPPNFFEFDTYYDYECDGGVARTEPRGAAQTVWMKVRNTDPQWEHGWMRHGFDGAGWQAGNFSSDPRPANDVSGPHLYLDFNGDSFLDQVNWFFRLEQIDPGPSSTPGFSPAIRFGPTGVGESDSDSPEDLVYSSQDVPPTFGGPKHFDQARTAFSYDYDLDGDAEILWNPVVETSGAQDDSGLKQGVWRLLDYRFDQLGGKWVTFEGNADFRAWWNDGKETNEIQPWTVGDFDGDGLDDVILQDSEGRWMLHRHIYSMSVPDSDPDWFGFREDPSEPDFDPSRSARPVPYLLARATNGYGFRQLVRYQPLGTSPAYQEDEACEAESVMCYPRGRFVVTQLRSSSANGADYIRDYEYWSWRTDLGTKRPLGFSRIRTTSYTSEEPSTQAISQVEFRDDRRSQAHPVPGALAFPRFQGRPFASNVTSRVTLHRSPGEPEDARVETYAYEVVDSSWGHWRLSGQPIRSGRLSSYSAKSFHAPMTGGLQSLLDSPGFGELWASTESLSSTVNAWSPSGTAADVSVTKGGETVTLLREIELIRPEFGAAGGDCGTTMPSYGLVAEGAPAGLPQHTADQTLPTQGFGPGLGAPRVMSETVVRPDYEDVRTTFEYCADGTLKRTVRLPEGADDERHEVEFSRDELGNLRSAVSRAPGEAERSLSFFYDDLEETYAQQVVDATGAVSESFYDPALGAALLVRDAFGIETRVEYDGFGRVRRYRTLGRNNGVHGDDLEVFHERASAEPWPAASALRLRTVSGAGFNTTATYDHSGRLLETIEDSSFGSGNVKMQVDYDARGLVARTYQPTFVGDPPLLAAEYQYDRLGRVASTTRANGAQTVVEYLGGAVRKFDAEGHPPWVYTYDDAGRLTEVQDPLGTAFCYEYDSRDVISRVTRGCHDGSGVEDVVFDHDRLGRLIFSHDPGSGGVEYEYNGYDEVTRVTDAEGREQVYEYDLLGRVSREVGAGFVRVSEYDVLPDDAPLPAGWQGGLSVPGRLVSSQVQTSFALEDGAQVGYGPKRKFSFDEFGRSVWSSLTVEAPEGQGVKPGTEVTYEQEMTFDSLGRLVGFRDAGRAGGLGPQLSYSYLPKGELAAVGLDDGSTLWELVEMDASARVTRERRGNATGVVRSYTDVGQVQSIRAGEMDAQGLLVGPADVWLKYKYTPNGNLEYKRDEVRVLQESYWYDELDRLEGQNLAWDNGDSDAYDIALKTFSFDRYGNLIYASDVGDMPSSAAGRLLDSPDGAPVYDMSGKVETFGGLSAEWTSDGEVSRLTRVGTLGSTRIDFDYGPEGALLRRVSDADNLPASNSTTYPTADIEVRDQAEAFGQSGEDVSFQRVAVGGATVAILRAVGEVVYDGQYAAIAEKDELYPVLDRLGSTVYMSEEDGVCSPDVDQSFDAWGRTIPMDWSAESSPVSQRVPGGYTGHRATTDLGLTDMGGRHYDAHLRRFLSPDPVTAAPYDTQGWSRYGYARGNPNAFTDPLGYWVAPPQTLCRTAGGGACQATAGAGLGGQAGLAFGQALGSLLSRLWGGTEGSTPAELEKGARAGWTTVPLEYQDHGPQFRGSAPGGGFSVMTGGTGGALDGPLDPLEVQDGLVAAMLGHLDEEHIQAKGARYNRWGRLMAADGFPDVSDAVLEVGSATAQEFLYGGAHDILGLGYGTYRTAVDAARGRVDILAARFATGVGEHVGQAILGLETIGAGVQTGSPGLVFDGYGDALAGVWKTAADVVAFRGLWGGLRGRPGCFVAGTLVETASGPRPIEELAVGDIVLAQDIETGKAVWREILSTHRREAVQTLELVLEYVDDDGALSSETLVLTEEHPLWVEDLGDWLAAGKVELGQRLSTLTGVGTVVGIELGQVRDVFNLEVEGAHNYFAGDGGVLAHNGVCGETSYFDAHVKAWRQHQAAKAGGAAPVRVGQAGEAAVRSAFNIGDKAKILINGRNRIPDGLTNRVLSEVKNVKSLSFTRQLRDFSDFAQQTGRRFDLFVRPNTRISGPLMDAVDQGLINLRFIP